MNSDQVSIDSNMTLTNSSSIPTTEVVNNFTETFNSTNNINDGNIAIATTTPRPPVPSLAELLNRYSEYRVSQQLGIYVLPVLIILGSIGNILSFLVMVKPTMRKSSTCFYMAAIATADMMVLYFSCLPKWLNNLKNVDVLTINTASCKIFNFLQYFSFGFSVWLLVAMTIERFIAIHFPLKAPQFATVSRAKKVTVFLFIIFLFYNLHFFFTVTIDDRKYCVPEKNFEDFHDNIWPWIDATTYSFLPLIILFIFNIFIICDSQKAIRMQSSLRECGRQYSSRYENRQKFNSKLTIMLLTVSFAFLIMSSPKVTLFLIRREVFNFTKNGGLDFHLIAVYSLITNITDVFLYSNHSVNFLLYCISGAKFRDELKKLFFKSTTTTVQTLTSIYSQRRNSNQTNTSIISTGDNCHNTQVVENYV